MHPETIQSLAMGQLYIKTPDGNTAPLRGSQIQIVHAPEPDPVEDGIGAVIWQCKAPPPTITIELAPGPEYDAWVYACGQLYLQAVSEAAEKVKNDVIAWATEKRPKWLHIAARTKKKRTREKYAKRILRAYAEEMEK